MTEMILQNAYDRCWGPVVAVALHIRTMSVNLGFLFGGNKTKKKEKEKSCRLRCDFF